jgi:cell fate (sporulation/competence/biofilm development) regulator YlbF (YheA/YmcA/DUF963 family)
MANVCALPIRYKAGAAQDPLLVDAAQALADALEGSQEYQDFVRLASAINEDAQVSDLLSQIRARHANYQQAGNGDLVARLEGVEVMRAYRAAELSLRRLCFEIDQLTGEQAGLAFSTHIRPQGHG